MGASFEVTIGGDVFRIQLQGNGRALISGSELQYSVIAIGMGSFQLITNSQVHKVESDSTEGSIKTGRPFDLRIDGRHIEVIVDDDRSRLLKSINSPKKTVSGPTTVKAPMPGLVSKVEVAKGDHVIPGQGLVILEAMKMENEIRASVHGQIQEVFVQAGRPVEKGEPILTIA